MWTPITRLQHSRPSAIPNGYERRGMGDHRAAFASAASTWPSSQPAGARAVERDLLRPPLRLPLAAASTDLPPWSSVYRWFAYWRDICLFERINHALVMRDRERAGRQASPSAAIIDSQSVKTTKFRGTSASTPARRSRGERGHALVDTDGRALLIEPHRADIQDRDGGAALLKMSRSNLSLYERVFADGGYTGDRMANATEIIVEIVRKQADQVGFVLLPRRWVVERFFAWINRNRRLAKDVEATVASASAFLYAAAAVIMLRRLARAE